MLQCTGPVVESAQGDLCFVGCQGVLCWSKPGRFSKKNLRRCNIPVNHGGVTDKADENNRDKITSLKDVFSEIDAYNSRQPDVCSEIGVSSSNNTVHNQTLGGQDLLMELESLRQENKELTEKIDRMNKEQEIERSVHEQNKGQFAMLNVEDIHVKDVSDEINSTVVLVDTQTSSLSPRNEQLIPDLENYYIPTPIQIFSDPNNIAEMDRIANLHCNRIGWA
ncbi:hypothetical protein OROMI_027807 [Orobanche minor]